MPGTHNFQQWNPTAANQESDAAYTADAQRSGGAANPSIFDATTANKLFFQVSVFVAALADSLATKGYSLSDANRSTLAGVLANLVAQTDLASALASYVTSSALAADLSAYVTSSALATDLAAYALLSQFPNSLAGNGYQKLPGGLILQWANNLGGGAFDSGGHQAVGWNYPITFPNAVVAIVATPGNYGGQLYGTASLIAGPFGNSSASFSISLDAADDSLSGPLQANAIALGY